MAEYLIYNKEHWFETSPNQAELNIDGEFDSRYTRGDIIEVRPTYYWVGSAGENLRGFDKQSFVMARTTDETYDQAINFWKNWKRAYTYSFDLRDDVNGIYEYTITLTNISLSGRELFTARDRFQRLPDKISIIDKSANFVKLRLTLPAEWTIEQKTEKRLQFQDEGKDRLRELLKIIARSKYYFDLASLPNNYKNLLRNQGWIQGTRTQFVNYLKNKAE